MFRRPLRFTLFPYTTLFRSTSADEMKLTGNLHQIGLAPSTFGALVRSEEHTSELQSRLHLVCRLLLEKKKKISQYIAFHNSLRYLCQFSRIISVSHEVFNES